MPGDRPATAGLSHPRVCGEVSMAAGTGLPPQLITFWTVGEGARRIGWGRSGDFESCKRHIQEAITKDGKAPLTEGVINGLCATLHKIATGAAPGHAPGEHHA